MFTGIIAHLGSVRSSQADARGGFTLVIDAPELVAEDLAPKDSVNVNGVCLTIATIEGESFRFDVVPETMRRSNLGALRPGEKVNLEAALRLGDRLSGHLVYGHVDATVAIRAKRPEGQGFRLSVPRPADLVRFIVSKGCIALDGVSLTVASVGDDEFDVALIPESAARTTLGIKGAGALLNLEVDPVARYACDSVAAYQDADAPTSDELAWAYEI